MPTENEIQIGPRKLPFLRSGCKMYSIRKGHRAFAKNLRVTSGEEWINCITNTYTHTTFSEVPFFILESEGFQSFKEALETLRIYYPDIDYETKVTIVEFRLAL